MMINHFGVTDGGEPLLKLPSSESLMSFIHVRDRMDGAVFLPPKWPQCVDYLNTHYKSLSMEALTFTALVQNISNRVLEGVGRLSLSDAASDISDATIGDILNDIKNQKYGIEWSSVGDTLIYESLGHFEEWEVVHTDGNIQGLLYYDPDIEHRDERLAERYNLLSDNPNTDLVDRIVDYLEHRLLDERDDD